MRLLLLAGILLLAGCVNQLAQMSSNLSNVEIGMTEAQVVTAIGKPTAVSAKDGVKIYNYKLYTTTSAAVMDGTPENFYIFFKEGAVIAYGGVEELRALSK